MALVPQRRPTRIAHAPLPVDGTGGVRLPYGHGAHEAVGWGRRVQSGPVRERPSPTHCIGFTQDRILACAPLDPGGLGESLLHHELGYLADVGCLETGDGLYVAHVRWVRDGGMVAPGESEIFHRADDLGRIVGIAVGQETYKWLVI